MNPCSLISLWTDGAYRHGHAPGYGWLACVGKRVVAQGAGSVTNDGTGSLAGEIAAALAALDWAVGQGVRRVVLHTDCATLPLHFRRMAPSPCGFRAAAHAWTLAHQDVEVEFVKSPSVHPLLSQAHHLSRAAKIVVNACPASP